MKSEKKTWRDLIVWQKSHQLVMEVYKKIKSYPSEEKYSLIDQTRRAALSVPTNLVEGQSRNSTKDFIRFLIISRSSLEELRYLLLLAKELNYLSDAEYTQFENHALEISVMINKLIAALSITNKRYHKISKF